MRLIASESYPGGVSATSARSITNWIMVRNLLLCALFAPVAFSSFTGTGRETAATCTYKPNCDLGHGTRDSAPAKTKEECCALCKAKAGCAAGVLSGGTCWFKTAANIGHGCSHSSRVDYACFSGNAPPGPPPPPSCNDPTCIALKNEYDAIKNDTCAKVVSQAPAPNAQDIASFMKLYQAFTGQKGQNEQAIIDLATKILGQSQMAAFLSRPDTFSAGGLDAAMVQCAVMTEATSTGLAEFAKVSSANKALITKLFADPILMRDMLVAGGAVSSETDKGRPGPKQYGAAMAIYQKIIAASETLTRVIENEKAKVTSSASLWDDRSQQTVLKRFALGLALEHAVPIHLHYRTKECDQDYDWCPANDPPADFNVTIVDPVARYMHYENAYKAGELDPAFEVLSAFECKHTSNSPASDEDLAWIRASMGIYRPENIAMSYHWRYARSVSTDVAYGDPMCAKWGPAVCSGHYAEIPAADGVCGPRAFFGRATRLAFGLPTWGATQPGHAAMSTWSPDEGWHTLLGAGWPSCWWGARSGSDWVLETKAREVRTDFQKVLRGTWVSIALGEAPAGIDWGHGGSASGYGQGGPWAALMLYAKKISAAKPPVPRAIGPAVVPSKVAALIAAWPTQLPTPQVTVAANKITIPAAAYTSKNRSCSLSVMKSNEAPYDTQQITHNGCRSSVGPPCAAPTGSSWQYTVDAENDGDYFLTANFTTWHMDQDLLLSVNGGKELTVPVYYTVGWWNQTQPIEVSLQKGNNTLSFYRTTTRPLVFKAFYLYKSKPGSIPLPPSNYTPSPAPHYPNASQYIEVAADTTCVKQGITPVPQQDCSRACLALGFKGTGPRARPNISGCFVMTEGQYAGNCNYNTNASATCTPPCTLYGAIVRSLCIRA